jgi:hypothetical protein
MESLYLTLNIHAYLFQRMLQIQPYTTWLLRKATGVRIKNYIIYAGYEVFTERPEEISLPRASASFLLGLLFEPEDGSDMFF